MATLSLNICNIQPQSPEHLQGKVLPACAKAIPAHATGKFSTDQLSSIATPKHNVTQASSGGEVASGTSTTILEDSVGVLQDFQPRPAAEQERSLVEHAVKPMLAHILRFLVDEIHKTEVDEVPGHVSDASNRIRQQFQSTLETLLSREATPYGSLHRVICFEKNHGTSPTMPYISVIEAVPLGGMEYPIILLVDTFLVNAHFTREKTPNLIYKAMHDGWHYIYIPGPATCSTNSGEDEGHDDRESIPEDHEQQINLDHIQVWAEAVSEERRHMGHVPAGGRRKSGVWSPCCQSYGPPSWSYKWQQHIACLDMTTILSSCVEFFYTMQLCVPLWVFRRFQDARNDENFEKSLESESEDLNSARQRTGEHVPCTLQWDQGRAKMGLSGERQGSAGVSPAYDLPKKTQVKPPN
ncbi:hypothetical protein C8J57DRAFT_1230880 [Mycena rebaudengoi]|nr:hypothetical protein C8J57DRAFT_1230880 [Mycena rebaudengoi]